MPSSAPFPYKFGWLPDLPDSRDYTSAHPKIAPLLAKKSSKVPSSVDLRPFCPPIFDQGDMGSCIANERTGAATTDLMQLLEKQFGKGITTRT